MTVPVTQSVNGLCNAHFTVGFRKPTTYESTNGQCSSSGCTSCLEKRAQKLECRGLETSEESRFQLLNADGRLRIWHLAHEAMDLACQVGTVQEYGGSIMV
ncbi:transposable element Tcb2 transposase [Trichonephila clavipes]|nr:transposable element Tcb2 transposase [Trichonephila clavipes]